MTRRRHVFDNIHQALTGAGQHQPELRAAATDLDRTAGGFDDAVQHMMDARPGLPGAASYDGPTSHGGTSSPTERAYDTPDPGASDRATLDHLLRQLTTWTTTTPITAPAGQVTATTGHLWRLCVAWTPKAATPSQRRVADQTAPHGDECRLSRDMLGIHVRAYRTTTLGGLLPEPEPVGRWVYDQARRAGRLPTPTELRRWDSIERRTARTAQR